MAKLTIIVATHGRFGEELVRSAEMIAGAMTDVYTLSLLPEKSFEDFLQEATDLLERITGPVIALVDLFGGTPSNVLTVLTRKYAHQVITGLNLPILLDLYMQASAAETIQLEDLVGNCFTVGHESMVLTNERLDEEE